MAPLKKVFIATRPWSFPMTILVVLTATLITPAVGLTINWLLLIIAVVGSVLLHAMVNVLNDYFDYKRGIDRPGTGTVEYRPHPILHGILTPRGTLTLGIGFGIVGLILAGIAAAMGRPYALTLGVLGFIVAFLYTGPPFPLKYNALGELGVYIAWGVLIPLGSYYLVTGELSIYPVLVALPLSILIVDVLLANNIRDIEADESAGITTLATVLGYKGSTILFKGLIYAAYIASFLVVVLNKTLVIAPLLALLTINEASKVAAMFDEGKAPPDAYPRTAMVVQKFAILYLAGLIIGVVINYII
ncbi:MAG: UbiA family prenyltransferase, partial [Desulfurococcales archaeon]|nr:UbiA family prenyltransferase [Desulfurococcales archaeon]